MKKGWKVFLCVVLAIVIVCGGIFVLAYDENPALAAGQTLDGDFITTGTEITNDGNVLGDFICGAQSLINTGSVEGDLIAGISMADIAGDIQGSVRIIGSEINLSALVERNVMAVANKVVLDKDSYIGKNGYIFGSTVISEGIVKGDLTLSGQNITLSGTYEGNVKVNTTGGENATFKLLPGTVIKGKLTYLGVNNYELPAGVMVGEYEFVKIEPSIQAKPTFTIRSIIRTLIAMLIYYLFALLIYKLFPRFFAQSGQIIGTQPLNVAGFGIATFGCLVGGAIILIILLFIIVLITNFSVFAYLLLVYAFILVMIGLLASIPVSIWLGNTVSNRKGSVPGSLAIGLAIITVVNLLLEYLNTISAISGIVGVISFIVEVAIWVFGAGAVIKTIFAIGKAANMQAEAEYVEKPFSTNYDTNYDTATINDSSYYSNTDYDNSDDNNSDDTPQ